MRYILATALLMTVGMTSSASAGCGPAIQNWVNGSKMTCTYDSNTGAVEATPAAAPAAPPVIEEDKCHEKEGYEGRKSYKSRDGFKSFRSSRQSKDRGGDES
jgi:hypothetical protein